MITDTDFLEMPDRNQWIADNIMDGERNSVPIATDDYANFTFQIRAFEYASWEGAGRIIEKMESRGFDWVLRRTSLDVYEMEFIDFMDTTHYAEADTPETAIALAAGRAMGEIE